MEIEMNHNSFVALGQQICVVCGSTFESGEILINKKLEDIPDDQRITGTGLCPEHQKLCDDGYVALVEIDESKSTSNNGRIKPADAYRTGNLAHVKRQPFREIFNTDLDEQVPVVFIEVGVIEMLQMKAEV